MLDRYPGPLTLHPSKRKWLIVLLGCAAFVGLGIWMIEDTPLGWFVSLFFGASVTVAAILLLPGAIALRLDAEGFETVRFFCRRRMSWRDASDFEAVEMPHNVKSWFMKMRPVSRGIADINRLLAGRNASLPDNFGLSPEELAELMNKWRARSLRWRG